jgi:hypothetical protein
MKNDCVGYEQSLAQILFLSPRPSVIAAAGALLMSETCTAAV